jgi:hypothetical protein
VTVIDAAGFPDAVARALPASSRFPEGADEAVPTWADRVAQMREVIARAGRGSLR